MTFLFGPLAWLLTANTQLHKTPVVINHVSEKQEHKDTDKYIDSKLTLELDVDKKDHKVSFEAEDVKDFTNVSYQLTYDTSTVPQGVTGSDTLHHQREYHSKTILLGTCSNNVCVFNQNPHNFILTVTLSNSSKTITLTKTHN